MQQDRLDLLAWDLLKGLGALERRDQSMNRLLQTPMRRSQALRTGSYASDGYADGEQRAEVRKKHGEFYAPVLRLPVSDVDGRMLRQTLNKLKGKHSSALDNAEYLRILQQGEKEDLKELFESAGERLPLDSEEREPSLTIPETYEIVVECKDEADQRSKFQKFQPEGYKLRLLTL